MRPGSNHQISCRGITLDLTVPRVMGILNATPDSFSDGGYFDSKQAALDRIDEMVGEGADIIDVGGESTRPGAEPVSADEEIRRVIPILTSAVSRFPSVLFSIDTTKYEVAEAALEAGAHILNDVSGLRKEPRFAGLCSQYGAAYILMHSQGDPETMQQNPTYGNVITDLNRFFRNQLSILKREKVGSVILDPGIGFGKNLEHNLQIIAGLSSFAVHGCPLMAGASRKSMIGQILHGRPVSDRLAGTLAVHYHCMVNGARLLRVHDVRAAVDSVEVFEAIRSVES
ncbi:MAG: dihydropteroate synthase [Balneolaceae bacterium]